MSSAPVSLARNLPLWSEPYYKQAKKVEIDNKNQNNLKF